MLSHILNARVLLSSATLILGVFGLPWLALMCTIALCLRYRAWEIVAIGMYLDLLWLPNGVSVESPPIATIVACVLLLSLEMFRRQLMVQHSYN